jgi:hypothetical protein
VGEDPEQLEREIERTRAKLGDDLDALEEKINPKKVANRSVDRAKGKAAEVKDKVVGAAGAAKEKVVGAAGEAKEKVSGSGGSTGSEPSGITAADVDYAGTGVGAGATAPDGRSGGGIGDKVAGLAATAKEKAAPLAATAKEKAAPLAATAKEKAAPLAATAKEKAAPLAATAKEKAASRAGLDPQTADTREVATAVAGGAWQTLREQTRRNPVAVGAAAFVLGVLIGR